MQNKMEEKERMLNKVQRSTRNDTLTVEEFQSLRVQKSKIL